jgi:hypothetical protein
MDLIDTQHKHLMSLYFVSHFLIDMQNVIMLSFIMPSVVMLNYVKCHYVEYHYTEYRYAEYRYAECRGAVINLVSPNSKDLRLQLCEKVYIIGPGKNSAQFDND